MTLRQDYYDGTTGLQAQLAAAFTAGAALVTANSATLGTALQTAAAQGKTTFTVTITTTYNPTALRLKGLLLNSYLDGIQSALFDEGIFSYECSLELNTSDTLTTSIDFDFTFQVT